MRHVVNPAQSTESARAVFFEGVRKVLPILVGVLPFGVVVGVVSADLELTAVQTFGRSFLIFAGVAELVILDLYEQNVSAWIIILSAMVINLRQIIYSASVSRHYKTVGLGWKLLLSYTLVDQVFAFSTQYFDEHPNSIYKHWFHLGTAVPIVIVWFSAIVLGFFVGAIFPESWSFDFIVPLMFLSMIPPAIKGYSYIAAGLVSATVALMAHGLPNNLGLLVATFSGILVGVILEKSS